MGREHTAPPAGTAPAAGGVEDTGLHPLLSYGKRNSLSQLNLEEGTTFAVTTNG